MSSLSPHGKPAPYRAIIVGGGAYGASLAYWLSQITASGKESWAVTLLERSGDGEVAPDGASHDHNKIIRADYDDPNYRALGKEAIRAWRDPKLPFSKFYHEVGVVFRSGYGGQAQKVVATPTDNAYVDASVKGAAEADEGLATGVSDAQDKDTVQIPPLAYRLDSPIAAKGAFPAASRERLGEAVTTIGARGVDGQLQQDAWLNPRGGWAESGLATRVTLRLAQSITRQHGVNFDVFPRTQVASLLFDDEDTERVLGVTTVDGRKFSLNEDEMEDGKSCVVFCTGSWTRDLLQHVLPPYALKLFPHSLPVAPSAQAVITVQLTPELAKKYDQVPVVLNFGSGFYSFAPTADGIMKGAIHSVGYRYPRPSTRAVVADAQADQPPTFSEGHAGQKGPTPVNVLDTTAAAEFPTANAKLDAMLSELGETFPEVEAYARGCLASADPKVRARIGTRLCHYSDTRNEDWLIDQVPGIRGLTLASGDSGHGFKFLPNLGRLIAARIGAGVDSGVIPPLTQHQLKVFSFAFHNDLLTRQEDIGGADSNRFSGLLGTADPGAPQAKL